ncbi:MAG: gliding motility-associated C-terminal domain-containing protein [Elusimicrobia bacterium]|nr:gliding motility-associated C-terminal domain-containing protein [Elusimicrobiota bacterium]
MNIRSWRHPCGVSLGLLLLGISLPPGHTQTEKAGQVLFSPNGDGIVDSAVFRLGVSNPASVAKWEFSITNNMGREVKRFSGKGAPPSTLDWDGKDEHNQLIPDGTYSYTLSVVTIAGSSERIPLRELVCDRQSPSAQVAVEPAVFSPEEGSAKPTARFAMQALDANGIHSWLLKIQLLEGGGTIKSFFGKGSPPEHVEWDGRKDGNEPAANGEYIFTLAVRDRAGNTTMTPPRTVTIDRGEPVMVIDARPNIFSPNGDGIQDVVLFELNSSTVRKVIEGWALQIQNLKGKPIRSFQGSGAPPQEIPWDGKDTGGRLMEDGVYAYSVTTVDQAGNRGVTIPKTLILDNAPPQVNVEIAPTLLSPNGDGTTDIGNFQIDIQEPNGIRSYALGIVNDVGEVKKIFKGEGMPPKQIQWAGQGEDGKTLLDGRYTYSLTVVDRAGNKTISAPKPIQVDTTPPRVDVSAEPRLISFSSDQKEVHFQVSAQDASELDTWSLEIRSAREPTKVVRQFAGTGTPSRLLTWDGRTDTKEPLPDGAYTYTLQAQDKAHNMAISSPETITVGSQIPRISIRSNLPSFSPNADGTKDSVTFAMEVQSFNKIQQWEVKLVDASGMVFRKFLGHEPPPAELIWGGEKDDKSRAPDGLYRYTLRVIDEAGNQNATAPQNILVDTNSPQILVQAVPALFSPNGDGSLDQIAFQLRYLDVNPAGPWHLTIKNKGNRIVRTFSGNGELPASITWEGVSDEKKGVPDGTYTYGLFAEDAVGNHFYTADQILQVDNTPPAITLSAEPTIFAPKTDGSKNRTIFSLAVQDASDLADWTLQILNAGSKLIHSFKGSGRPPAELPWEGVDSKNNVFPDGKYTGQLLVKDQVGNQGRSQGVLVTIDTSKPVLVVSSEEELVPSLAPEALVHESSRGLVISLAAEVLFEMGKANIRPEAFLTLDEAAAVVKKYPTRHVLIEGHTDNTPIHTPEFPSNEALSMARAKAVIDYFVNTGKIAVAHFTAKGHGDSRPAADNSTVGGKRKNRRVEIIIQNEEKNISAAPTKP